MSQVSYGTITIVDTNDIESITIEYAQNQSSSDPPESGWRTTRPTWKQNYFIWQRTRIHKSGTTADKDSFGAAVCLTGSTGSSGTSVTISSIKYAISTTESQPADSRFTYTSVPSVAEGSWLWTLVTYSNGSKAYTKSKQGVSGDSITVSKVEYQSGTSPTTAPTGTWQTSIPTVAEGNYLWTKTTYSDGNYTYSVAKQGKSGTSISIQSTSTTYQVSSSPTTTPTGEWKTTVQSTTTGQYLWTRTIVTYSDGNSTTSYSVAAHGASGTSVSISSIKYAISSTDSQPSDSSFTYTTVPTVNEGQWLWTLTTYSNGSKMYTKAKQGKSGDDGRSLTNTVTKYAHVAKDSTEAQVKALAESNWTVNVPSYSASLPDYWVRIVNTYDVAPLEEKIYYKDNGLTEAIAKSVEANSNASNALDKANEANSIASHANEDAQGALGIARAMQQNFWWWGEDHTVDSSFTLPAGAYTSDIKVDTFKANPTGGYLVTRSDGIYLNNGRYVLMGLTGNALKFYRPGTTQLLSGTETVDAELTSNGLVLSKGGIKSGSINADNSGFIYLSTENYGSNLTINGHQASNWREIIGTKFGVDADGNLYASSANVKGVITATSGTIGGWTINSSYGIYTNGKTTNTSTNTGILIQKDGAIYAGKYNSTNQACPFQITSDGVLTATSGSIAGWSFNGTSLYKNNAAPGASANAMVISTGTSSDYSIAGSSGINTWMLSAGTNFGVTTNGTLYATGANITGVLNITDPEASNIYTISAANEQIKNTQDTVDALRGEVATQAENIADIQEQSQQFASSTDLQATRGIVDQYLGDNGAIKLDNTGILLSRGQFQLLITSQELDFLDAGQTVASLSNQALNITSAIITSNLTLEPFKWVVSTNRLTLMRI